MSGTEPAATTRTQRALRWTVWMVIASAPIMLLLLVWQLMTLSPDVWCDATADAARDAGRAPRDCTSLFTTLLGIKDHAIVGLLMIVGMSFFVIILTALGMRADVSGPGGLRGSFGRDTLASPVVTATTTTTTLSGEPPSSPPSAS